IVGANGIGKSTAVGILSNKINPNFGNQMTTSITDHFKGTELFKFFTLKQKATIKPQSIDVWSRLHKSTIKHALSGLTVDEQLLDKLELSNLLDREVKHLSGGELQRFAIYLAL